MENPYVVLGVSESATPEVLQIAYEGKLKALARSGIARAERKAEEAQLHRAYRVLSDPRKRAAYDAELAGAHEKAGQRSGTGRLAIAGAVVVAACAGLGWYLSDREERLEAVRQQEAALAREAAAARARAAAEELERRRRGVDDAMAESKARKQEADERQRLARERRKHEVEAAQAQAAAEREAALQRNRR